jgi:V8-like Glu-specific endopeptidase
MTSLVGNSNTSSPYSSVVLITATFADGYTQTGSGSVVGTNDILTASHVVWTAAHGAAVSVTATPGYDNGAAPFGTYSAKTWSYFEWDTNKDGLVSQGEASRDVAVLGFSEHLTDKVTAFSMDTGYASGSVHVSGYPAKYADQTTGALRMTDDTGGGSESSGTFNFNSDIEINPGNSGGPVWYQGASGPTVVGVVSTRAWAADLSTTDSQIHAWMASNDSLMFNQAPDYVYKVARLYEAGLDRAFERDGLSYWVNQEEHGMSFTDMAGRFLDSPEFTSRFGDDDKMSNGTFVTQMYKNVLDRAPEKAGYDYWTSKMDAGMSREQVLLGFSESKENIDHSAYLNTMHQVSAGVWDI